MADSDAAEEQDAVALGRLGQLGIAASAVQRLAGDASTRRFFRVRVRGGGSVVVTVYPPSAEGQANHDVAAQNWARSAGLPVPDVVAAGGRLVVSGDLGSEDLEEALRRQRSGVLEATRATLKTFQAVPWQDAPNPAFDAAFFRHELEGFETHFVAPGDAEEGRLASFMDNLAKAVASHPYRLTHRDFHLNNLFVHAGKVWAVDFQDLRGGPDTYDAASLLYERAAPELIADPMGWAEQTAMACGWDGDWRRRLLECRAQRGLKVLGTFVRLTRERGAAVYAEWLPVVREQTAAALRPLNPPPAVLRLLESAHPAERL